MVNLNNGTQLSLTSLSSWETRVLKMSEVGFLKNHLANLSTVDLLNREPCYFSEIYKLGHKYFYQLISFHQSIVSD